jgi:hypothetical protein
MLLYISCPVCPHLWLTLVASSQPIWPPQAIPLALPSTLTSGLIITQRFSLEPSQMTLKCRWATNIPISTRPQATTGHSQLSWLHHTTQSQL